MSTLAPTLQAFFTDRLARQRQASPHTIAAYRDTVKLLLVFAEQRTGKSPSAMDITDLDAPLIGAFLNHLETDRGNSVRTRNARLAAIHSLFRCCALHHPQDAAVIARVLAIPPKRFDRAVITYLTEARPRGRSHSSSRALTCSACSREWHRASRSSAYVDRRIMRTVV